jgi:Uma2 family endonuclease
MKVLDKKITIDEYLEKERVSKTRNEFISGEPEFIRDKQDIPTNPICVIEVLSESTKNYDRGEKFEFYRSVNSIQEYILVDQDRIHIEQFIYKEKNNWKLIEYNSVDGKFLLSSLGIELKISDVYKRVKFA